MLRTIALFLLLLGAGPFAQAQTPKLPQLAVMPLEARQVTSDEATILSEALATELQNSGEVRVMERSQMDKILSEQGFQQSGACSGTECAVQVGQLLGIDRMVVGSLGRLGKSYVLVVRLVDVGTGEVLRSSTRQAQGEIDQILTSLVPDVVADILGHSTKPLVPPDIRFSSLPFPDLWSDTLICTWQASSARPLQDVHLGLFRPGRSDSAVASVSRTVKGTFVQGDFLLVLPARLDTGAYILRLWVRDASDLTGTMEIPVRRHARIRESSHWGWWLFGGLALLGGGGTVAILATDHGNNPISSTPQNSNNRSVTFSW